MKGILGYLIFFVGLGVLIGKGANTWIMILGCVALVFGLNWIIEDKVEEAKEELKNELEDK